MEEGGKEGGKEGKRKRKEWKRKGKEGTISQKVYLSVWLVILQETEPSKKSKNFLFIPSSVNFKLASDHNFSRNQSVSVPLTAFGQACWEVRSAIESEEPGLQS